MNYFKEEDLKLKAKRAILDLANESRYTDNYDASALEEVHEYIKKILADLEDLRNIPF